MSRRVKLKEREQDYETQDQCHHYWIIEAANGPKSSGTCKYCGEVRDFYNTMPDINVTKRKNNVLHLPKVPRVELDEESKS